MVSREFHIPKESLDPIQVKGAMILNVWLIVGIISILVVAVLAAWFGMGFFVRTMMNRQADQVVKRIFTELYTKNLWEGVHALRRFGVETVIENELRASHEGPLMKPLGSARPFPNFDGLLFTPAQLYKRPLNDTVAVNVASTLGKRCGRPMTLSIPIMVTAMGYGVALSKPFVHALAKGTASVGTAFNSGQGPVLKEYRSLAHRLIVQYHGGSWKPSDEDIAHADMVEIRYGQGANAGSSTIVPAADLTSELLQDFGVSSTDSGNLKIPAGIPGVQKAQDLKRLVQRLRMVAKGAPIAIKLAAGADIMRDMEVAAYADVDVIVIDGAQAGTHGSPAILVDDFGIPTLSALCKAVQFLKEHRLENEIDLVVSGGLRTPGDTLKALCLGARAVYMGNAILFATMHEQITKALPFEPPTQLAWANGSLHEQFDEDLGAQSLARFLTNSTEEVKAGLRALGKMSIADLKAEDMVAWDPEVARITGLPLV